MGPVKRLLTLLEAAERLQINPEVLRRWLRAGRITGVKVGSDWRLRESDIEEYFTPAGAAQAPATQGPKMCVKFPKWLEHSGLPARVNEALGPQGWPTLKKLIELDYVREERVGRDLDLDVVDVCECTGYDEKTVETMLEGLVREGYIVITKSKRGSTRRYAICTPIRTPRIILDIPFEQGGVKGAPEKVLQNRCLRRYLETEN